MTGDEHLKQIYRTLEGVSRNVQEVRERVYNGLSEAVERIDRNVQQIQKDVAAAHRRIDRRVKIEDWIRARQTDAISGREKWAYVGIAVIMSIVGAFIGRLF